MRRTPIADFFTGGTALVAIWIEVASDDGFNFITFFILWGIMMLFVWPFRIGANVLFRMNSRPCPVCGERVKVGETVCGHCQYDFKVR